MLNYLDRVNPMNIELRLIGPTWIDSKSDDPEDQCAHGKVRFKVGEVSFLDETEEFTVSAAALFLLRSLFSNHSGDESVTDGNYLFPCCGFSLFKISLPNKKRSIIGALAKFWTSKPLEKEEAPDYPVLILGCPSGADIDVTHSHDTVTISAGEREVSVPKSVWFEAVLGFACQVSNFYNDCTEKVTSKDEEEREGWQLFWNEFAQLRHRAQREAA